MKPRAVHVARGLGPVGLVGLAALAVSAGPLPAQVAPRATYLAEQSFQLPPKGQPGAPEHPTALAQGRGGTVHVADESGLVFVYDSAGVYRRSYGADRLRRPVALAVALNGDAYVLDADRREVSVFGPGGQPLRTLSGPGGEPGELSAPIDLALGPAGYVYVLDAGHKAVEIFGRDGVFVREIAVGDVVEVPAALAVGNDGTIYLCDARVGDRVFAYPPFTELRWSGDVPMGIAARIPLHGGRLEAPTAMAVNGFGTVLVLDRKSGRLWLRNPADEPERGARDIVYGGKGTGRGSFREAVDVALAGPFDVMILDAKLRKVERIRLAAEEKRDPKADFAFPIRVSRVDLTIPAPLVALGGRGDGTPLFLLNVKGRALSLLGGARAIRRTVYGDSVPAFTPDPNAFQAHFSRGLNEVGRAIVNDSTVWVTDPGRDRFAIYGIAGGTPQGAFGDNYRDDRRLHDPHGIAMTADGRVVIGDTGNDRIKIFSPDLASLLASVPFRRAYGVAVAPGGDILVWDEDGLTVGRLPKDGNRVEAFGRDLIPGQVADLTFDRAGNLFVLDRNTGRVTVIDAALDRVLVQLGDPDAVDRPDRVIVDRWGNIYVADAGRERTIVYRWDVHFPPLAGLTAKYAADAVELAWRPGPEGYVYGYRVEGAPDADGPYARLTTIQTPGLRIELPVADSSGAAGAEAGPAPSDGHTASPGSAGLPTSESAVRYVRVAPVYLTGAAGTPTEPVPVFNLSAAAELTAGNDSAALRDAARGLELIQQGAVEADDAGRTRLGQLGFRAAYRQGDYAAAIRLGSNLLETAPRTNPEFFVRLARSYLELGRARDAGQSLLTLVASGAPGPFQDSAVIATSFRIYHDLAADGSAGDGLAFLRQYQRSMPGTVARLRAAYLDSIAVFDTRVKLGRGFEYWRDANYPEVIRFFKEMLRAADLSSEQKVLCHELLAAAYYAFGRKQEAAAYFGRIYRIRPDFDLETEMSRIQHAYGLTSLYNAETRRFFGRLRASS